MEGDRQKQSEQRTDLAEDRTVLANERTFAGWLRTALAAVGLGVAFHALFDDMQPAWAPRAIASTFIATALVIIFLAEKNARRVLTRLNSHAVKPVKGVNLVIVAILVAAGSLTLLAGIWWLV